MKPLIAPSESPYDDLRADFCHLGNTRVGLFVALPRSSPIPWYLLPAGTHRGGSRALAIASAKSNERHLLSTSPHQVSHPPYSQLNTLTVPQKLDLGRQCRSLDQLHHQKKPCRPPKSMSLILHRLQCRPPSATTSQARCSRKQRPYRRFRRRFSPNVRRGGGWMRCVSGRCSC